MGQLGKGCEATFQKIIGTGFSVRIVKNMIFKDKEMKHDVLTEKQHTDAQAAKRMRSDIRYIDNCQAAFYQSENKCMRCGTDCSVYHLQCKECKRYICKDCSNQEKGLCSQCFIGRYDNCRTPAYNQETRGKKYLEEDWYIKYKEDLKQKIFWYSTHGLPGHARRRRANPFEA